MRRALLLFVSLLLLCGCHRAQPPQDAEKPTGSMALQYARNFAVDYYADGAARLQIAEQDFLLLPADAPVPPGLEGLKQIPVPAENIYLASSSVPDLFSRIGALEKVSYVSTNIENWNLPELREAMEKEEILYAGKYSAPDYELLLSGGCGLVVENSMILHSPATREKLEALGLLVLLEYSSYEPHPLGRVEWVRLYGLLTGKSAEAEDFFRHQCESFRALETAEPTGKNAAFFHLSASGGVVVRRQTDYVTRMIELAGGKSALTELPESESALSTVTIQMESFYAQARQADVLIYNSTAAQEVRNLEEFLALNPLFRDFKAVKEGNVWCTDKSMFQRSSAAADMIRELHMVFSGGEADGMEYLYRLE